MNISMKSWLSERCGRIFLMATIFWKPSTPRMRAFHTSAMPPVAIFSSSTYWPKRMPSVGSSSSTGAGAGAAVGVTSGDESAIFSVAYGVDGAGGGGGGATGAGFGAAGAGVVGGLHGSPRSGCERRPIIEQVAEDFIRSERLLRREHRRRPAHAEHLLHLAQKLGLGVRLGKDIRGAEAHGILLGTLAVVAGDGEQDGRALQRIASADGANQLGGADFRDDR